MTLPSRYEAAMREHGTEAEEALRIFRDYAPNAPRVPGMSTVVRLAVRLANSAEGDPVSAASKEYLYRWRLALDAFAGHVERGGRSNPFASHYAPHAIGL